VLVYAKQKRGLSFLTIMMMMMITTNTVPLPPCWHQGENMYGFYSFLNSELGGTNSQRHAPAALYLQESASATLWVGGWVGLRAGLDTESVTIIIVTTIVTSSYHNVNNNENYDILQLSWTGSTNHLPFRV
jgi:hypothetical protein